MLIDYTIQPGHSYCDQSPFLGHKLQPGIKGINFKMILNPSLLFDTRTSSGNNSVQKLLGISWGQDNHRFSYRIGWSMSSVTGKRIKLNAYAYHNGTRINVPFQETYQKIKLIGDVEVSGQILFFRSFNFIRLDIPQYGIYYDMPYDFTNVPDTDIYQLYFFVELPGHNLMHVQISQDYLF